MATPSAVRTVSSRACRAGSPHRTDGCCCALGSTVPDWPAGLTEGAGLAAAAGLAVTTGGVVAAASGCPADAVLHPVTAPLPASSAATTSPVLIRPARI